LCENKNCLAISDGSGGSERENIAIVIDDDK
jgi:hypothetical protein